MRQVTFQLQAGADHLAESSIQLHRQLTLEALEHLRALWAQFSPRRIILGLLVLGLSIPTLISLYIGVRNGGSKWDVYVRLALETASIAGIGSGSVLGTVAGAYTRQPMVALKTFVIAFALASESALIFPLFMATLPRHWSIQSIIGPIVLFAHAISFASNSFIMWEDRVVIFLLVTIPLIHLIKALTAPTANMRVRIIAFSLIFALLVRLAGAITVCREEQQPYCHVTFYAGLSASSPRWALVALIPLAMATTKVVSSILELSKSFSGPAPVFVKTWRAILISGAIYWIFEWAEHWPGLQPARIPLVQTIKLWLARGAIGVTLGALPYMWWSSGLCIEVHREIEQTGEEKPVTVYGFANAFGSTYLLFLLIPFTLIQPVNQAMGQLALSAILTAMLLYLESIDTQRDAILMNRSFISSGPAEFDPATALIVRPTFSDVVPMALLGFLGFFSTGHQAVLTSIQWKAAFVGFSVVTYPFSPLLVVLNTWGPFLLSAVAVPSLAMWNISPKPQGGLPIIGHSLLVSLGFLIYHTVVTVSAAACAAWLRRHLMVWKVFAPRFMLAGVTLLVVDLGILLALSGGVRVTCWKVWRTFKSQSV